MYDATKKGAMLQSGFWPVYEKGEERMATALGNLVYRPELYETFSLKNGEYLGEGPGVIIVFSEND